MTKLSQDKGATDIALIDRTIGAYFDDACARYAAREALVSRHQDDRLTYAELRRRVDWLACGLMRLGLEKGDRIAIWSQNNWQWLVTQYATAKAGLVLVNINPAYRRAEVDYALNKVGCRAIVLSPSFKTSDYLEMLNDLAPELAKSAPGKLKAERLSALQFVIRLGEDKTPGMINFGELLTPPDDAEKDALANLGATLAADDPINIQFTSGTTGNPKGATLTHRNILNNGRFVGDAIRLTEQDRLCVPVPLYHCFGMVMANLGALTHGAALIYPAEAFDPLAVLQAVSQERCTALYGVPTMFIGALDHPEFARHDMSTLRTGIMAGSPCPIEVMKRVISQMNMSQVTIAYGMTETSPVSTQSSVDDSIELRVSTVGRVQPHVEIKIVDAEGATVPRGVTGEFCTRGYSVMRGYWGDIAKTAEAIDAEGWMHTGDLAVMDDNGYCNIVGRIKDLVIRGGENVYPREIEEFLYRHPKIKDVQVVGLPDKKYGEELCAWIVLRENETLSEDEVRDFCKGQIAHYKIPRYIRFVDGFPMTVTGKIQKFLIRDQMKQELGLDEIGTA
ncbi:MAG: AMP-binding protein [Rhodoblastus sp.]